MWVVVSISVFFSVYVNNLYPYDVCVSVIVNKTLINKKEVTNLKNNEERLRRVRRRAGGGIEIKLI